MSVPPNSRYQPDAPLPGGGLAIEASAGTGKTYALADLATRFVAETDLSVSDLLIVTFTRAATDELRARVRGRLIEVADHLRRGAEGPRDDLVLRHLLTKEEPRMLERLTVAVNEFDSATITTIHGFATQIRSALGLAVGVDPDARVVEEDLDLLDDVCADVLAAASGVHPADDLPKLKNLRDASRRVAGRPDIVLAPTADDPGVSAASALMGTLVRRSVDQLVDRRRRNGVRNFDDVLIELAEGLAGPRSAAAVLALRSRFKVALIDEFQDTDSVQWRIFRTLFASDTATAMVLVGDPKQAIYGFRGGDIETYLAAVGDGSRMVRRSLAVNWRSDGAALAALDRLLGGVTFGDRRIRFAPVEPADQNRHRRMYTVNGEPLPALSLRLAVGEGIDRTTARRGAEVKMPSADKAIAADLVAQVRGLLDGARIPVGDDADQLVPVRPQDIAVLVNRHEQCATVQAALADQGVPAVVARGGSVLLSPAADQVRWLLHAMARPSDPRRARMFALSWFGGWSAEQVAVASDDDLALIQEQVAGWSERLTDHSVADTLARVWSERGVAATVLSGPGGDRNMTDLDHLAELLHGASPNGRSSVAGLLAVLDTGPDTDEDADPDVDGDVTARRIESDAQAVQVMTLWTAKGLEFPIVCVPTLWRWTGANDPVLFVDPESGERTYDLTGGAAWPDQESGDERKRLAAAERTGESLRLLYVALTRAKHQTILWWANGRDSSKTALARVLFPPDDGPTDDVTGSPAAVSVPADSRILASLSHLEDGADDIVTVGAFGGPSGRVGHWKDGESTGSSEELAAARFTATPDRSTQRWSFTSIAHRSSSLSGDPYDHTQGDSGADDEQIEEPVGDPDASGSDGVDRSGGTVGTGALSLLPAGRISGPWSTRCWSGSTSRRSISVRSSKSESTASWLGALWTSHPRWAMSGRLARVAVCWSLDCSKRSPRPSVRYVRAGPWPTWGRTIVSTSSPSICDWGQGTVRRRWWRSDRSWWRGSMRPTPCSGGPTGWPQGLLTSPCPAI